VISLVMIYPVLFMVLGTFTTQHRFVDTVFLPIPDTLNLDLFWKALTYGVWDSYLWTLTRCIWYISVTLLVGLIAGYVFSKLRFPGKNRVFLYFLSGMVMPGILMLVPSYLLMAWFPLAGGNNIIGQGGHGFIQHWPVLFIGGLVPVFAIFLLKQSYDMLPTEYEDAAKMDGGGLWTIIFRVYMPLLKPPLVALTIVTFIGTWNDYLWPALTVSGVTALWPIAYRIQYVQLTQGVLGVDTTQFPEQMLKTFMATWPPAFVYFALQRYFVQGLVMSGLKG
jgi:multiple sugar transport system permease protein